MLDPDDKTVLVRSRSRLTGLPAVWAEGLLASGPHAAFVRFLYERLGATCSLTVVSVRPFLDLQ